MIFERPREKKATQLCEALKNTSVSPVYMTALVINCAGFHNVIEPNCGRFVHMMILLLFFFLSIQFESESDPFVPNASGRLLWETTEIYKSVIELLNL